MHSRAFAYNSQRQQQGTLEDENLHRCGSDRDLGVQSRPDIHASELGIPPAPGARANINAQLRSDRLGAQNTADVYIRLRRGRTGLCDLAWQLRCPVAGCYAALALPAPG